MSNPFPITAKAAAMAGETIGANQEDAERLRGEIANLDRFEKEAYQEAFDKDPRLIAAESNPVYFLDCENGNSKRAAERLCRYWSIRKRLFGSRAFLPLLDLSTRGGALEKKDIDLLVSGFLVNNATDTAGRSVYLLDRTRMPTECNRSVDEKLRVFFYQFTLAARKKENRVSGVTLIPVVSGILQDDFDHLKDSSGFCSQLARLFQEVLPVKLHRFHCICYPDKKQQEENSNSIPQFLRLLRRHFAKCCGFIRASVKDILEQELKALGLNLHDFPSFMGGSWSYTNRHATIIRDVPFSQKSPSTVSRCPLELLGLAAEQLLRADRGRQASVDRVEQESRSGKTDRFFKTTQRNGKRKSRPTSSKNESSRIEEWLDKKPSGSVDNGSTSIVRSRVFSIAQVRLMMYETISGMPKELRRDFDSSASPSIVEVETDPIRFYVFEKGDLGGAASRFVRHWSTRVRLFRDRAHLPLVQSGEGALSVADLEVLYQEHIRVLPNDSMGRSVLYFNLVNCAAPGLELMRCLFYCLSVVTENPQSVNKGIVLLVLTTNEDTGGSLLLTGLSSLRDVFPLKVQDVHLLIPSPLSPSNYLCQYLNETKTQLGAIAGRSVHVHCSGTGYNFAGSLIQHGLLSFQIPGSVGGTWSSADFFLWISSRKIVENSRYSGIFDRGFARNPSSQLRMMENLGARGIGTSGALSETALENIDLVGRRHISAVHDIQGVRPRGLGALPTAIAASRDRLSGSRDNQTIDVAMSKIAGPSFALNDAATKFPHKRPAGSPLPALNHEVEAAAARDGLTSSKRIAIEDYWRTKGSHGGGRCK